MDIVGSQVLGTLVTLLVLLFVRLKKKRAEKRREGGREYDPIEPERPGPKVKGSRLVSTVSRAYLLVVVVTIAMALLIITLEGERIHWLFYAAVAVAVLVYLILKAKESNATPHYNPDHPGEGRP